MNQKINGSNARLIYSYVWGQRCLTARDTHSRAMMCLKTLASESNPSSCISATSNPMRKRAFSESATQTTPRKSVAGHDRREDQMTQWSTPDLDQQRAAGDNRKENKGGTPTTIPLLCNSCWCHWCQRPSEYCGPFNCTSRYIWCLGISREEMNATKLPGRLYCEESSRDGRTLPIRHMIQSQRPASPTQSASTRDQGNFRLRR